MTGRENAGRKADFSTLVEMTAERVPVEMTILGEGLE
jgi:hypothetical protein